MPLTFKFQFNPFSFLNIHNFFFFFFFCAVCLNSGTKVLPAPLSSLSLNLLFNLQYIHKTYFAKQIWSSKKDKFVTVSYQYFHQISMKILCNEKLHSLFIHFNEHLYLQPKKYLKHLPSGTLTCTFYQLDITYHPNNITNHYTCNYILQQV